MIRSFRHKELEELFCRVEKRQRGGGLQAGRCGDWMEA
jgi:hypothetical protein